RRVPGFDGSVDAREADVEGRAEPGLRDDPDVAAALLDDPVHGREPETRALSDVLRGEERLEDPVLDPWVDPEAGGGAREEREVALHHRAVGRPAAELLVARLDRQPAAVRHRVARVDGEVHHHLLELALVRPDTAGAGVEAGDELDALVEDTLEER